MKMSGKEAYSLILRGFPDIMNVEEMCAALSISTKTGYDRTLRGMSSDTPLFSFPWTSKKPIHKTYVQQRRWDV